MDWQTFYERFFDWASSTQIQRVRQLTSFGPSDQVTEVAQELMDEKSASRFILICTQFSGHRYLN